MVGLGKFLRHRETIMSDIKHKVEQIRLHLVNRKDVLIYYRQFGHRVRNDTPTMWAEPPYFGPIVGIPSPTGPPEA